MSCSNWTDSSLKGSVSVNAASLEKLAIRSASCCFIQAEFLEATTHESYLSCAFESSWPCSAWEPSWCHGRLGWWGCLSSPKRGFVCRTPEGRTRWPAGANLSFRCSPLSSGQGMLGTTKSTIGYMLAADLVVDLDVPRYQRSHCETDWAPSERPQWVSSTAGEVHYHLPLGLLKPHWESSWSESGWGAAGLASSGLLHSNWSCFVDQLFAVVAAGTKDFGSFNSKIPPPCLLFDRSELILAESDLCRRSWQVMVDQGFVAVSHQLDWCFKLSLA